MANALVATDFDLAADVGLDFATKVAFEFEVAFKVVAESDELIVGSKRFTESYILGEIVAQTAAAAGQPEGLNASFLDVNRPIET